MLCFHSSARVLRYVSDTDDYEDLCTRTTGRLNRPQLDDSDDDTSNDSDDTTGRHAATHGQGGLCVLQSDAPVDVHSPETQAQAADVLTIPDDLVVRRCDDVDTERRGAVRKRIY